MDRQRRTIPGRVTRHVRELLGEFSSDEASETVEEVLALELRRVWKGRSSAKLNGVSMSVSEEASDMATSLSISDVGNANMLARLESYRNGGISPARQYADIAGRLAVYTVSSSKSLDNLRFMDAMVYMGEEERGQVRASSRTDCGGTTWESRKEEMGGVRETEGDLL